MCMCATRPVNAVRHHPFCMKRKYNHHHRRQSSHSNINENIPIPDRLPGQSTLQSGRSGKWHKRSLPDNMSLFAPTSIATDHRHFLAAPSAPSRNRKSTSSKFLNGGLDISSDLEISFASNVSLNSPPRENVSLVSECEPMDISPVPAVKPTGFGGKPARPRAFTSGARLFGADISNGVNNKSLMPSPNLAGDNANSVRSSSKKIQRSALPTEWLAPTMSLHEPSSPADDAMDVDTSYNVDAVPIAASATVHLSPIPNSAAPTITGFNQLFYDTLSPGATFESPLGHLPKKQRRSLSPSSARRTTLRAAQDDEESSPLGAMHSSPSEAKLERIINRASSGAQAKPTLHGLGAPSAGFLKRPRRPVVSAMVAPGDHLQAKSAYPTLSPPDSGSTAATEDNSPRGAPLARRAFSAFLPPTSIFAGPVSASIVEGQHQEEETSFEGEASWSDMSSPAQAYSRRQQVKTIRRCDGTEDFRPLTGVTALKLKESPFRGNAVTLSPSSKFMVATGLPGFGDNEAHGKILPCHRVTEDGLMRIKPQTLDNLLDGMYNDAIVDFHIIDCRFDYEYNGGHIPGAVNINTTAAVEDLLLGASLTKPRPSVSGDNAKKMVLIFHCEFSAKRAPTFAKHLRAKDRAMNNHVYPKIHYPEVYILEGGYCQYYKLSGHRCEPPAYVSMDDPNHALSRREDLDQFRKAKFGRHKSYAYGDGKGLPFGQQSQQLVQPKRNTAPQSLFAAATAAKSRRVLSGGALLVGAAAAVGPSAGVSGSTGNAAVAKSLTTLVEDGNVTVDADDTDTDLGDSPCPAPTKAMMMMKSKKLGVRGMVRSETYGPSRMNY